MTPCLVHPEKGVLSLLCALRASSEQRERAVNALSILSTDIGS